MNGRKERERKKGDRGIPVKISTVIRREKKNGLNKKGDGGRIG